MQYTDIIHISMVGPGESNTRRNFLKSKAYRSRNVGYTNGGTNTGSLGLLDVSLATWCAPRDFADSQRR